MSSKFIVCAPDRRASGHNFTFRAGRGWPSGQDVVVEVLDQDECPTVTNDYGQAIPDPLRLGRKAFAAVQADKRISYRPFGAPSPVEAVGKVSELEAELAKWKGEAADLAADNAVLSGRLTELETELQSVASREDALLAKVAELEATLEAATAPKGETKAEDKSAKGKGPKG